MKGNQKINQPNELFEMLPQAIAALKKNIIDPIFGESKTDKYANERPPLRSELFTAEQLEQQTAWLIARERVRGLARNRGVGTTDVSGRGGAHVGGVESGRRQASKHRERRRAHPCGLAHGAGRDSLSRD